MEQADEVARRLLTVAQSIENADYIRAAAQKPEELGPLLKTAIRRRGPVRHPTRAARQISDGHGAGVSVVQTTPESCILERAVKAGAQHGQAAEAASPKPVSPARSHSNMVPQRVTRSPKPGVAQTFTVATLREMTGLENTALNRYAKLAEVTTPRRVQRNFRYSRTDAQTILETITANTGEDALRAKCQIALRNLQQITE